MNEITIRIEGLRELTDAILLLTGEKTGGTLRQTMQTPAAQSVPMQQAPIQQVPVQQVPVQQMPYQTAPMQQLNHQPSVPVPTMQVPTMQVPTTAVAQDYTQDQLAVAAAGLVNQGKQPRLMELLHRYGVNSLIELQKERYGEFASALRAEGAVI